MKRKTSHAPARTRRLRSALLVLAAVLLLAGVVLAAGTPSIERRVIAAGGGRLEVPGHRLSGTLGQPVAGVASTWTDTLCAGFWCRPAGEPRPYATYLPLMLRDH